MRKLKYYYRIFQAYFSPQKSHLSFWHDIPKISERLWIGELGEYYMNFSEKAAYDGSFDKNGIPLLDYRGTIGKNYNPIAITQYGLGHYNLYKKTGDKKHLDIFLDQADWLVINLETNKCGLKVWMHHFDWEYREVLKAPWYSALAQGQGISALVRAYLETGQEIYLEATKKAFESFKYEIKEGGVKYTDNEGNVWFEEAIVNPPTHILNGFIWAIWGVYDYYLTTKDECALGLFNDSVKTIRANLHRFDLGFWSLYEQSGTRLKMLASPFYHSLHIVQLKVMHKITNDSVFKAYADRWQQYQRNRFFRFRALIQKIIFKLLYY